MTNVGPLKHTHDTSEGVSGSMQQFVLLLLRSCGEGRESWFLCDVLAVLLVRCSGLVSDQSIPNPQSQSSVHEPNTKNLTSLPG